MPAEYRVLWTAREEEDLIEIYEFVIDQSGYEDRAWSFVSTIQDSADSLSVFPKRGTARSDLVQGLRIVPCAKRAVLAYVVDDDAMLVRIVGVFYGGRDYERVLAKGTPIGS